MSRDTHSEDLFADTRMTFGEHLEDLSKHLWKAIYGFLVALIVGFAVGKPMLHFISAPVEEQLQQFYDERVDEVKTELDAGKNADVQRANDARPVERECPSAMLDNGRGG